MTTAAVPTPAPITFEDAPIPVKTRTTTPKSNPFTEAVQSLVGIEKSKSFTVPGQPTDQNVQKVVRQVQAAGSLTTPPVTVRKNVEAVGDKQTRITFWTRERITHADSQDAPVPETK